MAASYICNQIPHTALNMETPYKKALREGRRPLPSQDHWRKSLRIHQKPKQARPHVVGRNGVWLQRDREQLLLHLEPKNASRGGEQERCFHRNTTKSASHGQATLAATRSRVAVVRFQRRHARRQLRLARRHAVEHVGLYLRSEFRCRHACQNGRIASASTSLTRRNFP